MNSRILNGSLALFILGCSTEQQFTCKLESEESMRAAICSQVPIGMPVADARRYFEREGFKCHIWVDNEGRNRLTFARDDSAGFLIERNWRISIVASNERVAEIEVKMGYTGP